MKRPPPTGGLFFKVEWHERPYPSRACRAFLLASVGPRTSRSAFMSGGRGVNSAIGGPRSHKSLPAWQPEVGHGGADEELRVRFLAHAQPPLERLDAGTGAERQLAPRAGAVERPQEA